MGSKANTDPSFTTLAATELPLGSVADDLNEYRIEPNIFTFASLGDLKSHSLSVETRICRKLHDQRTESRQTTLHDNRVSLQKLCEC